MRCWTAKQIGEDISVSKMLTLRVCELSAQQLVIARMYLDRHLDVTPTLQIFDRVVFSSSGAVEKIELQVGKPSDAKKAPGRSRGHSH